MKNCVIYKNPTGIDQEKISLINSAIMSDDPTVKIPGNPVGTNSFYLNNVNNSDLGPRFIQPNSNDIAEDDATIDSRYIPGKGSILINRGLQP